MTLGSQPEPNQETDTQPTEPPRFPFKDFFMLVYIFRERERKREREGGRGTEREKERSPSKLHTVSAEPDVGLNPTNCEIMT